MLQDQFGHVMDIWVVERRQFAKNDEDLAEWQTGIFFDVSVDDAKKHFFILIDSRPIQSLDASGDPQEIQNIEQF